MSSSPQQTEPFILKTHEHPLTQTRKRHYIVVVCMCLANLLASCIFSVMVPFYPQEARRTKNDGSADTEVGLVFGIFALIALISSPVLGAHVDTIRPKFMLLSGIFLLGGATMLFGTLAYVDRWVPFLALSLAVRAVQGLGSAALVTSSWTIASSAFPDKVSTVMGTLEVMAGLGYMIGPSLGGALYKDNGFSLPFYVTGGLILTGIPSLMLVLPDETVPPHFHMDLGIKPTVRKLLKNVWVWLAALSGIIVTGGFAFLEATMGNFLEGTFGYKPHQIGLVFLLSGGLYMLASLITGFLSDKFGTKKFLVVGLLLSGVSMLFIGPSILLPFRFEKDLTLFFIAFSIYCVLNAFATVPVVADMICSSVHMGFKEGMELNGVVSGLASSGVSLGRLLGPSIGGALTASLDFRHSVTVIGLVTAGCGCFYLLCLGITKK